MNTWNWLLHFLIIFDLVAFGIYLEETFFSLLSAKFKKSQRRTMTWIFMILKLRPHRKSALYVWTQSECFILVR